MHMHTVYLTDGLHTYINKHFKNEDTEVVMADLEKYQSKAVSHYKANHTEVAY